MKLLAVVILSLYGLGSSAQYISKRKLDSLITHNPGEVRCAILSDISRLPLQLSRCENLTELIITNSDIDEFSIDEAVAKRLKILEFDYCRIQRIGSGFTKMKSLEKLVFHACHLIDYPTLKGLDSLNHCSFHWTYLKNPETYFCGLTRLNSLDITPDYNDSLYTQINSKTIKSLQTCLPNTKITLGIRKEK